MSTKRAVRSIEEVMKGLDDRQRITVDKEGRIRLADKHGPGEVVTDFRPTTWGVQ